MFGSLDLYLTLSLSLPLSIRAYSQTVTRTWSNGVSLDIPEHPDPRDHRLVWRYTSEEYVDIPSGRNVENVKNVIKHEKSI